MKIFKTLQELIDYVPNCIVCGKVMDIYLRGSIKVAPILPFTLWTLSNITLQLRMKDNIFVGNNKQNSVAINPIDNDIILGAEFINHLAINWLLVYKKCRTCRCKVTTKFTGPTIKNWKKFPPLTLTGEELCFTRKREKPTVILQNYYENSSSLGVQTHIVINCKPVNSLYLDLNKFKNLDHLNERLSTILTFS